MTRFPATFLALLTLLLPASSPAYTPPGPELMKKLQSFWARSRPVQVTVTLESVAGEEVREERITVPVKKLDPRPDREQILREGYVPFRYLTAPEEEISALLPSLMAPTSRVSMTRIEDAICFLVEGSGARIWLRKADLVPLRLELSSSSGEVLTMRYLEPTKLSERVQYPSRTEIERNGEVVYYERVHRPDQPSTP